MFYVHISRFNHHYIAAAFLAMQSVYLPQQLRPSVCPSVTRWYPIQTNEDRIMR